jgi:F0F1-type ATP synthase assembly protein I
VLTIDLPRARRVAFGVVLGQAGVTVAVALCSLGIAGQRAALSALLGGGIACVGSLAMAGVSFAGGVDARRALGTFYSGEAAKLVVVIGLFVVVLKTVSVAPLALFAGFAATWIVYWIALLAALPLQGGTRGA